MTTGAPGKDGDVKEIRKQIDDEEVEYKKVRKLVCLTSALLFVGSFRYLSFIQIECNLLIGTNLMMNGATAVHFKFKTLENE